MSGSNRPTEGGGAAGSGSAAGDAGGAGEAPLELDDLGPRFRAFVERLERPVVFLDTETTGTDPNNDRVIELSLVRVSPTPIGVEPAMTWRIDPQVRIPVEASRIHGITNEALAGCPTFAELAPQIARQLTGVDLGGFNVARFDLRILQAEFERAGQPLDLSDAAIVDAQVIFHKREPRTLTAALKFYRGKELVDAHGAEADTLATVEVFAGQLARYEDLPVEVKALHQLTQSQSDAFADRGRRFVWRDDEPVFNFGKLRGKSLRWAAADPGSRGYLRWMLDGSFDPDTKAIVQDALDGKIRQRAPKKGAGA